MYAAMQAGAFQRGWWRKIGKVGIGYRAMVVAGGRREGPRQDKGEHFPRKCNANAAERQPILYEMHIVKVLGGFPALEEIIKNYNNKYNYISFITFLSNHKVFKI